MDFRRTGRARPPDLSCSDLPFLEQADFREPFISRRHGTTQTVLETAIEILRRHRPRSNKRQPYRSGDRFGS